MTTPKLLHALRNTVRAKFDRFRTVYNSDTGSGTPPNIWLSADSGYVGNAPVHLATLAASHVAANMRDPTMRVLCSELRQMAAPVTGADDTGTEG